ncbi:MAG: SseB family protein [Varibaculum sp.]|nr:SseB family protein [Varibaculum sp.]
MPENGVPNPAALAARLRPNRFAGDTGVADSMLAAALRSPAAQRLAAVVSALPHSRLLVPVMPHSQPVPPTQDKSAGCGISDIQELRLPDGRRAARAYTDIDSFNVAEPLARPAPVTGRDLALLVIPGAARVMLNGELVIPRPALASIAQGDEWLPAWEDAELVEMLAERFTEVVGTKLVGIAAGENGSENIYVTLAPDLPDPKQAVSQLMRILAGLPRAILAMDTPTLVPLPADLQVDSDGKEK